ncbi:hypothetical protein BH23ACI1_BH23ACI1_30620 [soil metagenome]
MLFQDLVLVTFVALLLNTIILFGFGTRLRTGHWLFSLLLGAIVAGLSWWTMASFVVPSITLLQAVVGGVVITAIAAAIFDDWTSLGHVAIASTGAASTAFLGYAVFMVVTARLGSWSLAFAVVLLLLQTAAHLLVWTHTFEILDVICRRRWRRRDITAAVSAYRPKVSLHVPTHNEPAELVTQTLDALAQLDYPDFEVLVIDNNTDDEAVWRPVEAHCRQLGPRFRFFHLRPWPGYKSGALNFALAQTAADAEIVGVVDADYVVEPDFLSALVGHFADPKVAFVQTPQDYREVADRGRYGRALYLAYRVFFDLSMPSRNERNSIIYAGTMGLLRRSALEEAGGWDEWCITEDAEVSLRLLDAGYESLFVPRSFGRGLMPLDFAGLKKQRFRWAFGGMQILRLHAARLFNPWHKGQLTFAQRASYVIGGLQWLNDPLTFAFTLLLLIGSAALALGGSMYLQPLAGAAIFVPTLFVIIAVLRFLWAFRHAADCSYREAFDALTVLLGLTWVVTLACLRGLVSRHGVFLRTPKVAERITPVDVARVAASEITLGTLCLLAFAGVLLSGPAADLAGVRGVLLLLLAWQALIYFSAFRTSFWSYAAHPERQPLARRLDYHTTGPRIGPFVPEWRAAVWIMALSGALAFLFYVALRSAPTLERVMRTDPLGQHTLMSSLVRPSVTGRAGGVLVREADAIRRGDMESILRLWHPEGRIHDSNFTPHRTDDDRHWVGLAEVRDRYESELAVRTYVRLRHRNLQIELAGDRAYIQNDLDAVIRTPTGSYAVRLPRTDRWTLIRHGNEWRILQLELNRATDTQALQIVNAP